MTPFDALKLLAASSPSRERWLGSSWRTAGQYDVLRVRLPFRTAAADRKIRHLDGPNF